MRSETNSAKRNREWRAKNPHRHWYRLCPGRQKIYVSKNRSKVRSWKRRWFEKQAEGKTSNHVASRLRTRMYLALKGKRKMASNLSLIGCSHEDLKAHLESQFQPGMSWSNYGPEWHVDHKIPCASFDLTKLEDQKRCFHFSNLQPLWADQNRAKGSKIV